MKMSIKGRQPLPTSYSIAELRSDLARAVREAESGRPIEVTRRGRTVAVLLGAPEYERLHTGERDFGEGYSRFRQRVDLAELDIDPAEVFGSTRDRAPGREVSL